MNYLIGLLMNTDMAICVKIDNIYLCYSILMMHEIINYESFTIRVLVLTINTCLLVFIMVDTGDVLVVKYNFLPGK